MVQLLKRRTLALAGAAIAIATTAGCAWLQDISGLSLADLTQILADDSSTVSVVAFNLESGDADPVYLADQYLAPQQGVDLWGLSEVQNPEWLTVLEQGVEVGESSDFQAILGTTGGADRLALLYNTSLFEVIEAYELTELSFGGRVRAALVAQMKVRASGEEFLFMVNHLYRTNDEARHQQAQILNTWARGQTLPIIAVGDYNFDFNITEGDAGNRDRGFDLMTQDNIFTWVRPQPLMVSHCSDRYNNILDFIFVANGAKSWTVEDSTVLYSDAADDYCPDDSLQSDHFPVAATFVLPTGETP
ncbi:MAG: endonuclease/exonuclease/phosphatase family protein [Elainellaceae cyanobacterium]